MSSRHNNEISSWPHLKVRRFLHLRWFYSFSSCIFYVSVCSELLGSPLAPQTGSKSSECHSLWRGKMLQLCSYFPLFVRFFPTPSHIFPVPCQHFAPPFFSLLPLQSNKGEHSSLGGGDKALVFYKGHCYNTEHCSAFQWHFQHAAIQT